MDAPVYPEEDANTRLVNLQHVDDDEVDVYIGPANQMYHFDESPHNNPYPISEYGRKSALAHYAMYFYERYLDNEDYRESVHDLAGQTLAGWCYPERSHGEIIVDLVSAYEDGGFEAAVAHISEETTSIDTTELGYEGLKHKDAVESLLDEHGA